MEGVALRPLRTWKGEGASEKHMRQGPEGGPHPPKLGPRRSVLGPGGSKSKAGQGGDLGGRQTAVRERQNRWDAEVDSLPGDGAAEAGGTQLQALPGQGWSGRRKSSNKWTKA